MHRKKRVKNREQFYQVFCKRTLERFEMLKPSDVVEEINFEALCEGLNPQQSLYKECNFFIILREVGWGIGIGDSTPAFLKRKRDSCWHLFTCAKGQRYFPRLRRKTIDAKKPFLNQLLAKLKHKIVCFKINLNCT